MKNQNKLERISKVIARSSQYSRRRVEELIIEGRVKIDGKTINKPGINVSDRNKIRLDNKLINYKDLDEIYLFNKPKGCLVTHYDPENRKTIFDILPKLYLLNSKIDFKKIDFFYVSNPKKWQIKIFKRSRNRIKSHNAINRFRNKKI